MNDDEKRNINIAFWLCVLGVVQLGLYLYWSHL